MMIRVHAAQAYVSCHTSDFKKVKENISLPSRFSTSLSAIMTKILGPDVIYSTEIKFGTRLEETSVV